MVHAYLGSLSASLAVRMAQCVCVYGGRIPGVALRQLGRQDGAVCVCVCVRVVHTYLGSLCANFAVRMAQFSMSAAL